MPHILAVIIPIPRCLRAQPRINLIAVQWVVARLPIRRPYLSLHQGRQRENRQGHTTRNKSSHGLASFLLYSTYTGSNSLLASLEPSWIIKNCTTPVVTQMGEA